MLHALLAFAPFAPAALMLALAASAAWPAAGPRGLARRWNIAMGLCATALAFALVAAFAAPVPALLAPWLGPSAPGVFVAALAQALGLVIVAYSSRYLDGEPGQPRYLAAFGGVLAAVQLLLLAQHWLVLVLAWSAVGRCLQPLLCFYRERPFALLAAHKKRLADALADLLLVAAAALAWWQVGSGALGDLWAHLAREGASPALQASALLLAGAVFLRTAMLPVHGWLVQVMEAPTPVSALLHAGVVNLGGVVLVVFAPLLEQSFAARVLLVAMGLATATLAGLVMLTRVSIKVRLAWSTVAQMGFMVLECGLGMYSLAMLHLVGHSLYKAQAFLAASGVVRATRREAMQPHARASAASLLLAPPLAIAIVLAVQAVGGGDWPAWWSAIAGLALAPLLWIRGGDWRAAGVQAASGATMVAGLAALASLAHWLPLGVADAPDATLGPWALAAMGALCLAVSWLQWRPDGLPTWRRWSFAGFYVDEAYTRLGLRLWPRGWLRPGAPTAGPISDQRNPA